MSRVGEYAALSHRWGNNMPLLTTRATIADRLREISFQQLPKTFQEAVKLVRLLSIRYLWIDTLCIVQDDTKDWEIQAATMANIYSHAFITIAAAGAKGCESGLWHPSRNSAGGEWENSNFRLRFEGLHSNLGETPLVTRGWVLQEQILSRRVLYLAEPQMIWRCRSLTESEDGVLDAVYLDDYKWISYCPLVFNKQATRKTLTQLRAMWRQIVQEFSKRDLSFESDRIAAMAGVTSTFESLLTDQPLLGLWQMDLYEGLMWTLETTHKNKAITSSLDNIPSWSWLSVRAPVSYHYFWWRNNPMKESISYCNQSKIDVITASVSWMGTPQTSGVKDSTLILRGTIFKASLKVVDPEGIQGCHIQFVGSETSDRLKSTLSLDFPAEILPDTVWCLYLADIFYINSEDQTSTLDQIGLLGLLPVASTQQHTYRRIGIGSVKDLEQSDKKNDFLSRQPGLQEVIMTLV